MNKQSGISLIEIMIALLIGLFLLGGILQMFSASQQTYRMQSNLARLQENGRFALDFLARDIRMAGYWGCMSSSGGDISGTDGALGTPLGTADRPDSITLQGAFVLIPIGMCNTASNSVGSCCETDPSLTANNCPLGKKVNCYTDPSVVPPSSASSTIIYQIDKPDATSSMPDPKITLYRNTNNTVNPLIEGIENMQIFYGIDSDGDFAANYYVPAPPPSPDWNKVVSVRISLVVVTLDNYLTPQPKQIPYTYYVDNVLTNNIMPVPVPPVLVDRKIRRVFNTTIALRNNLP